MNPPPCSRNHPRLSQEMGESHLIAAWCWFSPLCPHHTPWKEVLSNQREKSKPRCCKWIWHHPSALKCLFPSLFCSKPFWRLPAVPHVSTVLLVSRAMHSINRGLCNRTFKNHKNPQNSQIKACSTWPWEKNFTPTTVHGLLSL